MQCKEFSKYYDVEHIPVHGKERNGIVRKNIRRVPWNSVERDYAEVMRAFKYPSVTVYK